MVYCQEKESERKLAMEKTNVMRLLDQKKIAYTPHFYDPGTTDGVSVAAMTGEDPACVFKTLVTEGASKRNYVFVIPVCCELELKLAAKAVGEKSIAMIRQAQLQPLTGYVHGGCSPVGMKKQFRTVIHESARDLPQMLVSAGRVGAQVELAPRDLAALVRAEFAHVAV